MVSIVNLPNLTAPFAILCVRADRVSSSIMCWILAFSSVDYGRKGRRKRRKRRRRRRRRKRRRRKGEEKRVGSKGNVSQVRVQMQETIACSPSHP